MSEEDRKNYPASYFKARGPARDQYGSLIELARAGREPLTLTDGSSRSWLEDGDEIVISATAAGPDGTRVGFGDAHGQIMPAWPPRA